MNKSLIIRLIDVVLLILFGFLAISDIQVKRQIRLPGPAEQQDQQQEQQTVYLFVKIDAEGGFRLLLDEEERLVSSDLTDLRKALLETVDIVRTAGNLPVVIIDPQPEATVQSTISVFDICEQQGLAKSINMRLAEGVPVGGERLEP